MSAIITLIFAGLSQIGSDSVQAAPQIPVSRMTWPGVVIIAILALFLCAAIAGPLIRANTRDELD